MKTAMGWMLAGLIGAVGTVFAQTPELSVPVCATAPRIDADLTDAAWAEAEKHTGFALIGTERPAGVQTTAWLCRDDAWLYMAFRCDEPSCIGMKRVGTVRDAGSGDDCVELFLDPGHDGKQYAHLTLTANNVQRDQWLRGKDRDRSWDMPWRSAAAVDPHLDTATGWSAELALPLCVLRDRAGKRPWRINVCRSRYATSPVEWTTLAKVAPAPKGLHDPSAFLPVKGLTGFPVERVFGPMLGLATATPFTVEDGTYVYGLAVTVRNKTRQAGCVDLIVTDVPRKGRPREEVVTVDLGAREEKVVPLSIAVARPGPREARVALREQETGMILQETAAVGMDRLLPVDAYVERNYYTSEPEAQVCAEVLLDRASRSAASLQVTAEVIGGDGEVLMSERARVAGAIVRVSLPLKGLTAGTYPVRVRIETGAEQELGALALELVKRPPAPEGMHAIKIDRYNRCLLLDGKPFFPLGGVGGSVVGPMEGSTEEFYRADLARCREAGFNVNMEWRRYAKEKDPLKARRQMYDLVREYGMYVIVGKVYENKNSERRQLSYSNPEFVAEALKAVSAMGPNLELTRSHPAVIGYYHFDEPQPRLKIDKALLAFYDAVRAADPYRPVYMSLTRYVHESQMAWPGQVTDLLGAHNYWYVMNEPCDLARMSGFWGVLDTYSRKMHLPTMTVPQLDLWGAGYSGGGFMTPAEQKAQTYLALVHGARSIIYFSQPWRHEKSVATQREISAEVHGLAPALLTREPEQEVTWTPEAACFTFGLGGVGQQGKVEDPEYPLVRVSLRTDPRGGQVLLAVNPNREQVSVSYQLSCLTGDAEVESALKPSTRYPVADGVFSDKLEPMGVRAYRIRGGSIPDDEPVRIHLTFSGPAVSAVGTVHKTPAPGKNLMLNPSFEAARMESWPDCWFGDNVRIHVPPSPRACGLDHKDPFHGKQCLRVVKDSRFMTYLVSTGVNVPKGREYTVSAWMRSEKADVMVRLYWGGEYGEFVLTEEWAPYSFTVTPTGGKKGRQLLQIWPWTRDDYTFYVDAIQVEEGPEATDYEEN